MKLAVATALSLITVWRLPTSRGTAQQRAGTLVLLFLTLAALVLDLDVRRAIDTSSGVADLSILLGHLAGLLTIVSGLEFAAAVTDADARRRTLLRRAEIAIAAAMTCMVVLFAVIPRRHDRPDFGGWRGGDLAVVGYQMLFQTCVGIGLCAALPFLARQRRSARPGPLRTALLLMWLGVAIGIVYVVSRMWTVLKQGLGLTTPIDGAVYNVGTGLLLQLTLLLVAVSAAIRLTYRCANYLRRHVAYYRLRGLWTTLTRAVPGTVLSPPPHPLVAFFAFRSMELLLYRRTVEIRDAQLELINRVPEETREAARTTLLEHGLDDDLALDACVLDIALGLSTDPAPAPNHGALSWSKAASLDGEVAILLDLSALLRNPAVKASTVDSRPVR